MSEGRADEAPEFSFGRLRELAQARDDYNAWAALLALLERWPDAEELEQRVVPYLRRTLESWSDNRRGLPSSWAAKLIEGDPRVLQLAELTRNPTTTADDHSPHEMLEALERLPPEQLASMASYVSTSANVDDLRCLDMLFDMLPAGCCTHLQIFSEGALEPDQQQRIAEIVRHPAIARLRRLDLSSLYDESLDFYEALASIETLRGLQRLDIRLTHPSSLVTERFLQAPLFDELEALSFEWEARGEGIMEMILARLDLQRLRRLKLDGPASPQEYAQLAACDFPDLRVLWLASLEESFHFAEDQRWGDCPSLTHLWLQQHRVDPIAGLDILELCRESSWSGAARHLHLSKRCLNMPEVEALGEGYPELRQLSIASIDAISADVLEALASQSMPKLEILSLPSSVQLESARFLTWAPWWPQLRAVVLDRLQVGVGFSPEDVAHLEYARLPETPHDLSPTWVYWFHGAPTELIG